MNHRKPGGQHSHPSDTISSPPSPSQCGYNDVSNDSVGAILRPKGSHKVTTRWVMANQTGGIYLYPAVTTAKARHTTNQTDGMCVCVRVRVLICVVPDASQRTYLRLVSRTGFGENATEAPSHALNTLTILEDSTDHYQRFIQSIKVITE